MHRLITSKIDCHSKNEWLPIIQWFYINETLLFLLQYFKVEKRSNLSNTSLVSSLLTYSQINNILTDFSSHENLSLLFFLITLLISYKFYGLSSRLTSVKTDFL
jgi:hypothetical protein